MLPSLEAKVPCAHIPTFRSMVTGMASEGLEAMLRAIALAEDTRSGDSASEAWEVWKALQFDIQGEIHPEAITYAEISSALVTVLGYLTADMPADVFQAKIDRLRAAALTAFDI